MKIVQLSELRDKGGILAHGCFDLIHIGHIRHLREARELDPSLPLTVGVTADRHISKGPGRPAFAAAVRAEWLSALECVDYIVILDDPTAINAILTIKPRWYVKGAEYAGRLLPEEIEAMSIVRGTVYHTVDFGDGICSGTLLTGVYLRRRISGHAG